MNSVLMIFFEVFTDVQKLFNQSGDFESYGMCVFFLDIAVKGDMYILTDTHLEPLLEKKKQKVCRSEPHS